MPSNYAEKFAELRSLEKGWNLDGADPPDQDAIDRAEHLVLAVRDWVRRVGAMADGGVMVTLHTRSTDEDARFAFYNGNQGATFVLHNAWDGTGCKPIPFICLVSPDAEKCEDEEAPDAE